MKRPPVRLALLALALALPACGKPAVPETPPLLRLWLDNGPDFPGGPVAAAPAPAAGAAASVPPAGKSDVLFECDFQDAGKAAWYSLVFDDAAPGAAPNSVPSQLRYAPIAPAGGALRLKHAESWAAVTSVPVRGGEAVRIVLAERAEAGEPGGSVPLLALVEMREPFDASKRLSSQDVVSLANPRQHATHIVEGTPGARAGEVSLTLVTGQLTRELALYVLAPTAPGFELVADRIAVRRESLTDFVVRGEGEFPGLQRLDAVRRSVAVALDRDERKGLLARPGERLQYSVGRCAGERRLDLAFGVAPRDGDIEGAMTVRVEADGKLLHEERLQAPAGPDEPAWRDLSLRLPPTPETSLVLTLSAEAEGADPPLVVFGHPEVRARGAPRRPNVVLISLDTLRPDRLGCYGGDKTLTPHLDALAADGLRFTQCSSTSSYTLPSHGSMLTGQYPPLHGAVDIEDRLDPARSPFLARILADQGYVTAAFTGGGYVAPDYGFAEGFDRYSSNDPVWALDSVRGTQLLQTASAQRPPEQQRELLRRYAAPMIDRWLVRQDDGVPFFAFLHTYIAHNYAPDHDWLVRRHLLDELNREVPFDHQDREAFNDPAGHPERHPTRDQVFREYMPYYDATVGMADEFVGGVIEALRSAGLLENTLVLVTSDHGEEFGEHGFFGHGETLFEPATRVPLIVRLPRSVLAMAAATQAPGETRTGSTVPAPPEPPLPRPALDQPAVVASPISLVDIAPWTLQLLGLPPDPRMALCSESGVEKTSPPRRSLLFLELDTRRSRLSAVRDGPLKLHVLLEGTGHGITVGQEQLFDLGPDRPESQDLAPSHPADVERLRKRLQQYHQCVESLHPRTERGAFDPTQLTPDQLEQLRQLGYIGPGAPAPPNPPPNR